MSKMSKKVKFITKASKMKPIKSNAVKNYMGGTSYTLNPLETLKIVSASSIFSEPKYYDEMAANPKHFSSNSFSPYSIFPEVSSYNSAAFMEQAIDEALSFDFAATLRWAATLRTAFNMRLNPQVIMVRAATHPLRKDFSDKNPSEFGRINKIVMSRADEPASQMTYYLSIHDGHISAIPSILKRSWAKKLESITPVQIHKYYKAECGMIDVVRVCHANSAAIDELMTTGRVAVVNENKTWENLKSEGKSWREILDTIKLGHMALLRNLNNIFTEIKDVQLCCALLTELEDGVLGGRQFPFRYYSAYRRLSDSQINHKNEILKSLEACISIACDNMPKLKGKTMCLSDNSGSAYDTFTSEYGSVTVADIDNLSSLITARNSDDGYIGIFGDRLECVPVTDEDILGQLTALEPISNKIGSGTENGIWLFFKKAIKAKEHWDNIFIYSDQQAGTGGLFGIDSDSYKEACVNDRYIDVAKLIDIYRTSVNPNVNVFSVQTAGYDNVLVPANGYRTSILYGWTGKELLYADTINRLWDEFDKTH